MKRFANASDWNSHQTVPIRGVLFDIDDTLVDLRGAALNGSLAISGPDLAHFHPDRQTDIAADFADGGSQSYELYMSGELTFLGQRQVRLQRAYQKAGILSPTGERYIRWAGEYEAKVRESWKPFNDVTAFLEILKKRNIPYGAVSNNVEEYQREKLRLSGLEGFRCVIGSDTAGVSKPHAAPFLAGCAELNSKPGHTLYIGDNPINDYQGAIDAGLQAILLDRVSLHTDFAGFSVRDLTSLGTRFT
ncbi:HAD family hydrolase [Glutamicibacter arilaitensis]|uniref:HAD family hydrolase n=1 Tax=Glutamicibacter arilaitensis TaxID=256701 RepID=UPI003A902374